MTGKESCGEITEAVVIERWREKERKALVHGRLGCEVSVRRWGYARKRELARKEWMAKEVVGSWRDSKGVKEEKRKEERCWKAYNSVRHLCA